MTAWATTGSVPAWAMESKTSAAVHGAARRPGAAGRSLLASAREVCPISRGTKAPELPPLARYWRISTARTSTRGHLLVKEFHQPLQGRGYLIGDEDQPDPAIPRGITGPLHFHERGHRVLVDDQMVDRPPAPAAVTLRDTGLTLDQQPTARIVLIDLCPGNKSG